MGQRLVPPAASARLSLLKPPPLAIGHPVSF